jgi:site-specific DNA recombinase
LARSYAYQILILEELARFDVAVRFADAPPLDDPQGRLLVQIQGVIAEHERAKFAERGRRGKLYRSRSGEVLSTKVPYGYRRVARGADGPAHVVIYEPEAAVVRRVFSDFLAGHSLRHLAVALSNDGTASPEGKPVWRLSTICRLLRNEAYVGRLYWNRTHTRYDPALGRNRQTLRPREEWIEIPIPAIIDEDTFDAAETRARDNSIYSPRRTEPDTFLLRRLLRCAACGVKLVCHRAHRGRQQPATTSARIAIRGVPVARTVAAPNGASEPTNSMPSCSTRYASCSPDPTCSPPVKRPWPNRLRRPTTSYSPPNWTDSNADSRPPAANEDGSPTFTRLE